MSAGSLLLACALAATLSGCATTGRDNYDWGKYDPAMFAYYKDPTKEADFEAALLAIIQPAGSRHGVVPPGIYAEYGYLRLQQGKPAEAINFFREEEAHWPESQVFMERIIKVVSAPVAAPSAPADTKGPTP